MSDEGIGNRRGTAASVAESVRQAIRDVPDFPQAGILFKDITPVLADPRLFTDVTHAMAERFSDADVSHVVGIESRGFIFGAPVAQHLGSAFVPARKRGKLPSRTESIEYALEYGVAAIEMHADALGVGARVLVVDDVLATGGTARAACELAERLGASVVGCSFLLQLSFLTRPEALAGRRVESLVSY